MTFAIYRKKGIRIGHVWFAQREDIPKLLRRGKADILYFHAVQSGWFPEKALKTAKVSTQHSLTIDLRPTGEELYEQLGKHLRKHISRSNREGTQIRFYSAETEDAELEKVIDQIARLFDKMYLDKGLHASFNRPLCLQYIKNSSLVIACSCFGGEMIGFVAAIYDQKHARNWISAQNFRNSGNDAQVVSRAHENLQWEMMLWCKDHGVLDYDLGGIVDPNTQSNGIADFKRKFSDHYVQYENVVLAGTVIGKVALKLKG